MTSNKPVVLITGSGGQLGLSFRQQENSFTQYHFIFAGKSMLPIEDAAAVDEFFAHHKIDYCINCAAYTAVDKAETETETAILINSVAAGSLASACKKYGAAFIHISTDYVFDGQGTVPYREADTVNPVNAYGASKLKGEQLIAAVNPAAVIIRTSWLYSSDGYNFVKTMLRLMASRESINVVNDQLGRPTYAPDLATAVMQMIAGNDLSGGLYHFSNTGEAISWFDFAVAIKEFTGSACVIYPVSTAEYPTPAKRPAYSVMDTSLIQQHYSMHIPHWKDSLNTCLQLLHPA